MTTQFPTTFQPDSPIVQDANWRFTNPDRAYIDGQILGIQRVMSAALVGGVLATYYVLDGASGGVSAGDVLCSSSNQPVGGLPTVTRALAAPLANVPLASGIALVAASPGARVLAAVAGLVPSSITGLSAGPGYARINTSTARAQNVTGFSATDVGLGAVDSQGTLALDLLINTVNGLVNVSFGPTKAGVVSGVERLTTTSTTPVSASGAAVYALADETHVDCVMTVVAKLSGGNTIWTQDYYVNYYRHSAGAPTISGSVGTGGRTLPTTLTGVSATWVVSGNNLVPQVTDATGSRTINWSITAQYQPVTD